MGKRINKFLISVLEVVLSIVSLLLFVTILLPLFLVLFVVCFVWRYILIVYVKLFRKSYAHIMGGKNPVLAIDTIHTRPLCTIVGMGAFDGKLDFERSLTFVQNIVSARDSKTGELLYPELQQYYEDWNGFIWWKWVKEFSINNHVTLWVPPREGEVSEEDFIQILGILEAKPFQKKTSPWEAVIVRNLRLRRVADENDTKTAIVFRSVF